MAGKSNREVHLEERCDGAKRIGRKPSAPARNWHSNDIYFNTILPLYCVSRNILNT